MTIKFFSTAALLIFGLSLNANAGITRGCTTTDAYPQAQVQVVSQDGSMMAQIQGQLATHHCELSTHKATQFFVGIKALNGTQLPRGGYLSGHFQVMDAAGNVLYAKDLENSYFVISSYPLPGDAKFARVLLEGFEPVILELK